MELVGPSQLPISLPLSLTFPSCCKQAGLTPRCTTDNLDPFPPKSLI